MTQLLQNITDTPSCSYPLITPIGRSFIHFWLMPATWPVNRRTINSIS